MLAFHALVAVFAALMLVRHGPRALLFVAPSLRRVRVGPPTPSRSPAEERARDALATLGFRHLGSLSERGPLGALEERWAVFASGDGRSWADVAVGRGGGWVRFVSPGAGDALLVTALPDSTPAGGLAAHGKGLEGFDSAPAPAELEARLEAARRFARGAARGDVRRATMMSFVNAILAALLVASSVNGLASGLKS
jgi:hypothetical protein